MKTKLVIIIVTVLFVFCSVNAFAGGRWHHFYNKKNEIMQKICDRWQSRFCDSVEPEPATEPEPEPEPEPATTATAPALKVYDADDQYLGVFVDRTYDSFEVLVPELNKVIGVRKDDGTAVSIHYGDVYFDGENCTGTAYTYSMELYDIISYNAYEYLPPTFQYTSINPEPKDVAAASKYVRGPGCFPTSIQGTMHEIVDIPADSIPLALPATIPLQLKYE
jgi:hypothetical protein